jgi:predicted thioesterase
MVMGTPDRSQAHGLVPGLQGHASTLVTEDLTAPVVGSGTVATYATPSLVALMEKAAVDCVERHLAPGEASLGVRIEVSHTAPTPPGLTVSATATLTAVEGRKLTFAIEARDDVEPIGTATHIRVVVDAKRFDARLARKSP